MFNITSAGYFCSDRHATPYRTVNYYELEVCISSDSKSYFDNLEFSRIENSFFLAQPSQKRKSLGGFECYYIHFSCDSESFCKNILNRIPTQIFMSNYADIIKDIKEIILLTKNEFHQNSDETTGLLIGSMLSTVLLKMYMSTMSAEQKSQHKYTENISNACRYITENFMKPLKNTDIARAAMLSTSFTYIEFKKETGYTPHEYLLNVRLNHACNRLIFTNLPITQISVECGFGNPNYLNYIFSKKYGTTPQKFRKFYRQNL